MFQLAIATVLGSIAFTSASPVANISTRTTTASNGGGQACANPDNGSFGPNGAGRYEGAEDISHCKWESSIQSENGNCLCPEACPNPRDGSFGPNGSSGVEGVEDSSHCKWENAIKFDNGVCTCPDLHENINTSGGDVTKTGGTIGTRTTTAAPTNTTVSGATTAADGATTVSGATSTRTNGTSTTGTSTTVTPTAGTASATGDDEENVCFPADATVELESGAVVRMAELSIGDMVKVGFNEFSRVFMFTHKMADEAHTFVSLKTESGALLKLTSGHYLYANGALVAAKTVSVGDVLTLGNGETSAVAAVGTVDGTGLFNPQTVNGNVVVNGVVSSTYTTAVEPSFAHAILAPFRILNRFGFSVTALESGGGVLADVAPRGQAIF